MTCTRKTPHQNSKTKRSIKMIFSMRGTLDITEIFVKIAGNFCNNVELPH
jgi:hypothetical protein